MAEICYGVASEGESPPCQSSSRAARRRRMNIRRVKIVGGANPPETTTENNELKRPRLELYSNSMSWMCDKNKNAVYNSRTEGQKEQAMPEPTLILTPILSPLESALLAPAVVYPKFGIASVCGRRRDMEDAVAVYPSLYQMGHQEELHYFAVFDGHGCSHVAMKCKERLHELVKEELLNKLQGSQEEWESAMGRSFSRMDLEVSVRNKSVIRATCRCELQTPDCDAVGSTAVVAIVTPDKIIIANCGDSRAVLCRNGKAIPLSNDHKPDRPDELNRIQEAGGRVIYWEGARVLGVLAMSRAIGDNYLKPYVICEPEVTIIDRTAEDDCLILASDGLWDVVSNETACGVARMCLKGKAPPSPAVLYSPENDINGENSDKVCADASMLLTKLALARRTSDNVSVVVVDLKKDA